MKALVTALLLSISASATMAMTMPTTNLPVLTWPETPTEPVTRNCISLEQNQDCS